MRHFGRSLLPVIGSILIACGPLAAAEPDYGAYARLLERYVEDSGVRYEAWASDEDDRAALDAVLEGFARIDPGSMTRDGRKAFYINLYNAAMLQAVLEHYPIDSVTRIGLIPFSIFKKDYIILGDRELSLDEVEKGILLEDYFDPRIHFAVNCASESCPPLRAEPYRGEGLEEQLEVQTRRFARSSQAARVDREEGVVRYSELFKWYADDFPGENPGMYLNRYRDADLPLDLEVGWIDYDWSLNTAQPL